MSNIIAAISTAIVKSAIGIVRMSGNGSIGLGEKIFKSKSNVEINEDVNKKLLYGHIFDGEEVIDEVLIAFMYGPYTYTGEDTVEIYCHGSIISLKKILDLLLKEGADLAEPGEFTKRAFLNARMDLSQAEAVGELIDAQTEKSYEASLNQLRGTLSSEIRSIRDKAQKLLADMEVLINFSEDEDYLDDTNIKDQIRSLKEGLIGLIDSSKKGKLIKDGIKTIILGKPNVGKSSLLNALLRQNRAIVTDIPGTTRDLIEEQIVIDSIPISIIDTAGIRDTEDSVEKIGVDRSIEISESADLIIGVFDGSKDLEDEDEKIIGLMKDRKSLALLNKTDLDRKISVQDLEERLGDTKVIESSIKNSQGIDELEKSISQMFYLGQIDAKDSLIVTNARHVDLLKKALANIEEAEEALNAGLPMEMIEVDVRTAWLNLGKITGANMDTEELLDQIFDEFCIGK